MRNVKKAMLNTWRQNCYRACSPKAQMFSGTKFCSHRIWSNLMCIYCGRYLVFHFSLQFHCWTEVFPQATAAVICRSWLMFWVLCYLSFCSLGMTILEAASDLDPPTSGPGWHDLRQENLPDSLFTSTYIRLLIPVSRGAIHFGLFVWLWRGDFRAPNSSSGIYLR